jgi:tetratricopeptide (TPR) repeat protein
MRIPALAFFAIVIVLAGALALTVMLLRSSVSSIPVARVDPAAERQHLAERDLRNQANALLRNGNTAQAYEKYQELNRLAPNSPAVTQILQQLDAARASAEVGRQQIAAARQKYDEGMAYYQEEDYDRAIPLFQEAFSINPSSDEIAKMLQSAKDNQARIQRDRASRGGRQQGELDDPSYGDPGAPAAQPARMAVAPIAGQPAAAPVTTAQLAVSFNSPWQDGTIVVNVGTQNILNEPLFEERGKLMFRRKYARNISVAKNFGPGAAPLDIQINVPTASIQERHVLPRVSFQPGSSHRLSITFDSETKKFHYQFS